MPHMVAIPAEGFELVQWPAAPVCGFQPVLCPPKGDEILGEDGLEGECICTRVPHIELVCLEAPVEACPEFYRCPVYISFCYAVPMVCVGRPVATLTVLLES